MDKVVIETNINNVLTKKVGRAKGGDVGHIYLPKSLIGKKVQIILPEEK